MPRDEPALQNVIHMDGHSIYSSMLSVVLKNSLETSQSPSHSLSRWFVRFQRQLQLHHNQDDKLD